MGLSFGTDGVRGVANTQLTPSFALDLGRTAARRLGSSQLVVGRDTRRSGPMLEAGFAAGAASEGATVHLLGEVPTPAVAHVCRVLGVAGAMISASHNPFADNGIKLFGVGGRKLTDDAEQQISSELAALDAPTRSGAAVGTIVDGSSLIGHYREFLAGVLGGRSLGGLRIVVDAANGAASGLAGAVFDAAGARVTTIAANPDGVNINERCGATHPDALGVAVREHGADLGLALDGDADRLIAVDHRGNIVDGDQVMAALALDFRSRGVLRHDTVVVTVMTNLGFRHAMAAAGIAVIDTAVGDRYVLDALEAGNFSLGGEQSGHVIARDLAGTGDGLLTGLLLADAVARADRPLADLAAVMRRLPQVLVNVKMAERDPTILDRMAPQIRAAETALGETGRVLVRASGTEPVVRVMVEAPTETQARSVAEQLAAEVVPPAR
jgi:phosphoglucosamine mutase